MGKLIMKSAPLSSDPEIKVPSFNFSRYQRGEEYHNDENRIDFVTDEKSLYVCLVSHTATEANIANEPGFLKLVSEGPQGIPGTKGDNGADAVTPTIGAEFIGDQLKLIINNKIAALSPSLTGPSWKPVLEDNVISWELTDDKYAPASIDLETLRPIQKSPLLLRTNSDNTKRSDETSGPANFIQWKYEGDEYWTNLMSISELMNLALAGVSIWRNEEDEKWHIGHREVVRASYSSDKNGRKIISDVVLGDVLFDAGPLPFAEQEQGNDYGPDIDLIYAQLAQLDASVVKSVNNIGPDANGNVNVPTANLDGYATEAWVTNGYQPKGNYLTQHQSLAGLVKGIKVNNGSVNSPDANGIVNLTVSVGETSLFDIRFDNSSHKLQKTTDGQNWIDLVDLDDFGSGISESDVKHIVGQILEGVLDSAIPEYVKGNDHNYFIRLSDLANYTTTSDVASMIRDAMTDNNVDYYRVFTLYQRTDSPTTAPAKPVVGVWEWNTAAEVDNITLKPNASSAWDNHPANATVAAPYLWITSATYSYLTKSEINANNQNPWETPICLTAQDGQDGVDGDGVEFMYILCTDTEFNNIKNTTPVPEHGDNRPDDLPTYTTPSGNGWTDHPSGISETYQIEAVSIRTKDNGTWSSYSNPTIWSMWGEDGVDGDGVEYIFHVDASDTLSNNLIPAQTLEAIYYTTNGQIDYSRPKPGYENYDSTDWVPDGSSGRPDQNWSDNPSDVDEQQPYEWVSIRKYNGQTGHWGPFSEPKIWGLWGQKTIIQQEVVSGTTVYKPYNCYAFTRTNVDISGYRVTGGQAYDDPLDGVVTKNGNTVVQMPWSDGIPNGTEQLWSIQALIGDESQSSDAAWSSPARVGDRPGFQVEFAPSNNNTDAVYNKTKTLPSLNNYLADTPEGVDEVAWRTAASNANCGSWNDESDENTVYMAESRIVAGSWTAWNVIKIKGEKGDPGDRGPQGPGGSNGTDGAGLEFVYYRTDSENHVPGTHSTLGTYDSESSVTRTEVSEDPDRNDFFPKAIASGFTLADGTYWHDHPQGVTEQLPCEWVAIRHSSPSVVMEGNVQVKHQNWGDFNVALWSKYGTNGRDGDGVEYVFFALTPEQYNDRRNFITGTNKVYVYDDVTNNSKTWQDNEYLPYIKLYGANNTTVTLTATDDNPGVTEARPYILCSMRKTTNGNWTRTFNVPNNGTSSFGPASLWIIGEEVDYTYADVNFDEDNTPVLVDAATYQPVKNSVSNKSNWIDFYHGNQRLICKQIDIKVNNTWQQFVTVALASGGTSMYTTTGYDINFDQNLVVSSKYSSTSDNGNQRLFITLKFTGAYALNDTLEIPVKLTSFESYINDSGNQTFYTAEGVLRFTPVLTPITLYLSTEGFIKKSSESASDYEFAGMSSLAGVFRTSVSDTSVDNIGFNGVSTFPTTYSNWAVKVLFDDVQVYNIALGNIYNTWRTNAWNNKDGESVGFNATTDKCEVKYDPDGTVRSVGSTSPIYVNISKTFTKDQHSDYHYVDDKIYIWIDNTNLASSLKDSIKFKLYDGVSLIDDELIPIIYPGKNGSSTEIIAYVETASSNIVISDGEEQEDEENPENANQGGGTRSVPTRSMAKGGEGGQNNNTPVIEIDDNGQIHITNNPDGTTTLSDDSGNYSVLDFENESLHKFQILKITEYDENNEPSVRYETKEVLSVQNIPSWYLIKDAFYYSGSVNGTTVRPQNSIIYALIVDDGQLVVLPVADNNPTTSGSGSDSGSGA